MIDAKRLIKKEPREAPTQLTLSITFAQRGINGCYCIAANVFVAHYFLALLAAIFCMHYYICCNVVDAFVAMYYYAQR